jgi:hypothetical protein
MSVPRHVYTMIAFLVSVMLLGRGIRAAHAEQTAADVIQELQREVAPRSGVACPPDAVYSLTRPDSRGEPTVVGVAVYFQDVAQLSDIDQTLDIDATILLRWRDPRLADASRASGSAECPVPNGKLWIPALEPENMRARQLFYPDRFLVNERGVVTLSRRIWAKVAYPLDFREFPFDSHSWQVTLWPVVSKSDEVVFHPLETFAGISDRLTIQGWQVGAPRLKATIASRKPKAGTYARLDISLDLERRWSYYAWKLGLPLTLIVLMAYGVYFIPASAVPQQVGLGMTAMLTLIAYMLTLGNSLPRISYLTRADRFFVGCAILVFFGLMKAVVTLALAQTAKASFTAGLDRWGRWLYPVGMLVNFASAFFV